MTITLQFVSPLRAHQMLKVGKIYIYYFLGGFLSWKLSFKVDAASCLILFSVKDPNQKFVRILIFFLSKC